MPPHWRHPQIPSSAQTSTPIFDTFFSPLFMVVTFKQMTIKHSMYTQKVPFLCTERACVVFIQLWDSPLKKSYVEQSVASLMDQREYILFHMPESSKGSPLPIPMPGGLQQVTSNSTNQCNKQSHHNCCQGTMSTYFQGACDDLKDHIYDSSASWHCNKLFTMKAIVKYVA